jgi:hypothetical protein
MNKKRASRRTKALWLLGAVLTVGFTWQGLVYWGRVLTEGKGAAIGLGLLTVLVEALVVGIWAGIVSRRSSSAAGIGIGFAAFLIASTVDVFLVRPLWSAYPVGILEALAIRLPLAIVAAVIGANIGTTFRVVAEDEQRYKNLPD